MAGARIRIELDDTEARLGLERLVARMRDPRPVLDEIGSYLVTSTIRRFEREVGPDGIRWPKSRRAEREGGQTLTDTGRLRASITHRLTPDAVEVGTNVVYAAIHQFGGAIRREARTQVLAFRARGRGFASRRSTRARRAGAVRVAFAQIGAHDIDMPARPFLGLDDRDREAILRIVERHLEAAA